MARLGPLLGTRTPGSSGTGNGILASADGRRLVSMGADGIGRFLYSLGKVGYLYLPLALEKVSDGGVTHVIDISRGTDETTTREYSYGTTFDFTAQDSPSTEKGLNYEEAKQKALDVFASCVREMDSTDGKPEMANRLFGGKVLAKLDGKKNLYVNAISDPQGTLPTFRASFGKSVSAVWNNGSSYHTVHLSHTFGNQVRFLCFATCAKGCRVAFPARIRIGLRADHRISDSEEVGLPIEIDALRLNAFPVGTVWDNECDNPITVGSAKPIPCQVNIHHPATQSLSSTFYEVDLEIIVEVPESRLVALSWDESSAMDAIRAAFDSDTGYETSSGDSWRTFSMSASVSLTIDFQATAPGVVHPVP